MDELSDVLESLEEPEKVSLNDEYERFHYIQTISTTKSIGQIFGDEESRVSGILEKMGV